jgi:hypothetical protein
MYWGEGRTSAAWQIGAHVDSHQAMSQSKQDTAGYVGDGQYSSVICICDYLAATDHTLPQRRVPRCSQMMSIVQRGPQTRTSSTNSRPRGALQLATPAMPRDRTAVWFALAAA